MSEDSSIESAGVFAFLWFGRLTDLSAGDSAFGVITNPCVSTTYSSSSRQVFLATAATVLQLRPKCCRLACKGTGSVTGCDLSVGRP